MAQPKYNNGADSWTATSVTLRLFRVSMSYRKQALWNQPLRVQLDKGMNFQLQIKSTINPVDENAWTE